MDQYLEKGKEIYRKYCCPPDNHPVMLPAAPQQTYIDVYPDDFCFEKDKRRQSNYEAEVSVYWALEKLPERIIALHGFEFTHHQYRLCDSIHDRRRCPRCKKKNAAQGHGECDFLIMCEGFFVIIEVKNMTRVGEVVESEPAMCLIQDHVHNTHQCNKKEQLRALNKTLSKSVEQREKVEKLIKSIDEEMKVFQFTAYPNFSKQFHEEFQQNENLKSTIIYQEDIKDFTYWWKENVILSPFLATKYTEAQTNPMFVEKLQKVRNLLLAIWCTKRDTPHLDRCSLGWCIKDIKEKLESGKFIFRKNIPDKISASKIIQDYLKVKNVTQQQHDALTSKEKFLWINGPAGTGKTVISAGRIICLVQRDDRNKVVLSRFCREGNNSRYYQSAFELAGITYRNMDTDDYTYTALQLSEEIA